MKVKIDADACTACGLCCDTCPDVFEMEDVAVVKVDVVPEDSEDCVREAAQTCPVECITVIEE